MTLLLDYSVARPDPAAIKAAGYSGVVRYLAPDNPLTHAKLLLPAERDALLEAGLTITLVWEYTAGRAAAGYQAGVDDAKAAEAQADALGYPKSCPIFYAVDFGTSPSVVTPYFQGIASVATRPVGVYGSLQVIEGVLNSGYATVAWQTCGWSGLAVSSRASLYQRLHPTVTSPLAGTDEDVLIHPFPVWAGTSAAPVVANPHPVASPIPPIFLAPKPAPPDLKLGMRGAAIRSLQAGLNHVFPAYSHLQVDGIFGPATFSVVKEFQARSGLTADGVVGPLTREALKRVGIIV
jgi:hypothetical protein